MDNCFLTQDYLRCLKHVCALHGTYLPVQVTAQSLEGMQIDWPAPDDLPADHQPSGHGKQRATEAQPCTVQGACEHSLRDV